MRKRGWFIQLQTVKHRESVGRSMGYQLIFNTQYISISDIKPDEVERAKRKKREAEEISKHQIGTYKLRHGKS